MYDLIDYKGKFDIIQDKDLKDSLDVVSGEISKEHALREANIRTQFAIYYGVPAYLGKDKELLEKYNFYRDRYEDNTNE